jgi:glycosyltransferase involved in cell wall biosynthesis
VAAQPEPQIDDDRPLISAAIIVRDEADFLRQCLASISPWCDEIVVVDTGSVDDTVAVAHSFGAVVGSFPWTGDFAAARNHALEMVTGRWVLYIDADEVIAPLTRAEVVEVLAANDDAVCLRAMFRWRPGFSPYHENRLWKHRDDVRFFGLIHESVVPDLNRISAVEGLAIRDTDVFQFTHYGYEGDQTHKNLRNLPLLERRVIENPERCYLWNHLGNVRSELGDPQGATAAWMTGIELVRRRGMVGDDDALCFGGLAHSMIERGEDASELLAEMAVIAPWFLTRYWLEASNHRAQGRFAESLEPLWALVAIGEDPVDIVLTYNNAMFTTWAWEALADSLVQLGDHEGAAELYEMACETEFAVLD